MSQINIIRNSTVIIRKLANTLVGSKLLFALYWTWKQQHLLSRFKINLFRKKIISTTGFHSVIIDLSNEVGFLFSNILSSINKYIGDSNGRHRSGGPSKN